MKQYLPPILKEFIKDKGDLMLINVIYNKPLKSNKYNDSLDIVYKIIETGEKKVVTIKHPCVYIAFTKPEYRNHNYPKIFEYADRCELRKVRYAKIKDEIFKDGGDGLAGLKKSCMEQGNFYGLNACHKYPFVYMSDLPIEVYYRIYWKLEFDTQVVKPLTKAFADIETNVRGIIGFPRPGQGEVICITVVDQPTMTSHTLYYRMRDNVEQVEKFERDIDNFRKKCNELFDASYGKIDYKFYAYDDELEMLRDLFKLKKALNRDFLLYWNMDFDINFLIARIEVLGGDPAKIICEQTYGAQSVFYYKDNNAFQVELKGDNFTANSGINYTDQMIVHAALRKSQSSLRTNKLNDTARHILNDSKLDYASETNIAMFPYTDFTKYILYNIKDVLLQLGIENKVKDIDNLYSKSDINCITYAKTFKQTKFLEARQMLEYLYQGLFVGNNINLNYGIESGSDVRDGIRFEGALVGDPELNTPNGIRLFGRFSKYIYRFVIDMDFEAMYPKIIIAHNISQNTMIGKIYIDETPADLVAKVNKALAAAEATKSGVAIDEDDEEDCDGLTTVDVEDRGGEFVDDLNTGDTLSTASRWFNLPSTIDLINIIKEGA